MTSGEIVCKPTPWFFFRAVVMLLMFGVFAVLFYLDGSTGYRKRNEEFHLRQAFKEASGKFSEMNTGGNLTPEDWRGFAGKQVVNIPADTPMPAAAPNPYPWPAILRDYEKMKPLQWEPLWVEYSGARGMNSKVKEHAFTRREISEQWVCFWVCLTLFLAALFFTVRTKLRSVAVDDAGLKTADGKRVSFSDMKRLDLRKWEGKGLAFIDYAGTSGSGRARIDGLTYGGFKKEDGEPAEKLMQHIRARFSGEIIEYASVEPDDTAGAEQSSVASESTATGNRSLRQNEEPR